MSRRAKGVDLTPEEETNVRTALRFFRTRCGTTEILAAALKFKRATIADVIGGATVTASLAFRVARLAGVGVDAVLAGDFPAPGTCPHCGHVKAAS